MNRVLIADISMQKPSRIMIVDTVTREHPYDKEQSLDHLQAVSVIKGLIQDYEVDQLLIDAPEKKALLETLGVLIDAEGLNLNIESGKIESMNKTYIE
jgi:NAD(P)H-hydrate repair Nnr-like enzyme with NAD(P)H-hydrate dehydratase domain